jgi:hypothetical protein
VRSRTALVAFQLAILFSQSAFAQDPTKPRVVQGPCTINWAPLDDKKQPAQDPLQSVLTADYLTSWATFQDTAKQLLDTAKTDGTSRSLQETPCTSSVYDYRARAIQLLWTAADVFGNQTLFSAFISEPPPPPYTTTLPGLAVIQQVFLSRHANDAVASLYTSTERSNPLLAQVPEVAAAILNPLAAFAAQIGGQTRKRQAAMAAAGQKPLTSALWATVSEVTLPYKRSAIEFNAAAVVTPTKLADDVAALSERLKTNEARNSACARKLADDLNGVFAPFAAVCAAATMPGAAQSCIAQLDARLSKAFKEALAACPGGPPKEDLDALQKVDAEFRKFLTELKPVEVKTTLKLKNQPLEHVSFGLAFAILGPTALSKVRVKLNDDGNVVNDPLGRQMSLVTINRSFKPFDRDTVNLTSAERYRWFAGAVITPGFGMALGASTLVTRGFGIDVGIAAIGVPALRKGDEIGKAPVNTDDPFGLGWAGTVFVGASYSFK